MADYPATTPSFPNDATLEGKTFSDVDGLGQDHTSWMAHVGAEISAMAGDLRTKSLSSFASRLIVAGHSWAAPAGNVADTSWANNAIAWTRDKAKWPNILADALAVDRSNMLLICPVPPSNKANTGTGVIAADAATNVTTIIGMIPEDALVQGVSYIPAATITGANTNTRKLELKVGAVLGQTTISALQFNSGTNATLGIEKVMAHLNIAALGGVSFQYISAAATPGLTSPNLNAVNPFTALGTSPTSTLTWVSTAVGTGIADPGGLVIVRLAGRFRNLAVASSFQSLGGMYLGGWQTAMCFAPLPQVPSQPVNLTAAPSAGATTVSCEVTYLAIPASVRLEFSGGAIAKVSTAGAAVASTSIPLGRTVTDGATNSNTTLTSATGAFTAGDIGLRVSGTNIPANTTISSINSSTSVVISNAATGTGTGITVTIGALSTAALAGEQGYAYSGANAGSGLSNAAAGDSVSPNGLVVLNWGANDAGSSDRVAYREALRSVAAWYSCPWRDSSDANNHVFAAGNGASAAWTTGGAGVAGAALGWRYNHGAYTPTRFTGAVGATKPTITIEIGPDFEGGPIDLFFLALADTSKGARATITVDGSNPPNGSCIIDTSGASPIHNFGTLASVGTTSASPNLTGGFSEFDRGKLITGAGIPADTFISSVVAGTSAVMSRNATATASVTATITGYVPMVKRLTGLSAGGRTILVTVDSIDATTGAANLMYLGYGIEATDPNQTIAVLNTAILPQSTAATQTTIANINTDVAAVIAGTAALIGSGTTEPALHSGVMLVDVNAALNAEQNLFMYDGGHPNARGHAVIAKAILDKLRQSTAVGDTQLLAH